MATLKSRLEQLEAKAPAENGTFCLVLHGTGDCGKSKADAIAAYVNLHGCEPVNFFDVFFVSTGPGGRRCGCHRNADTEAACSA